MALYSEFASIPRQIKIMTLSLKSVSMMAVSTVATSLAVGLPGSASAFSFSDYNLVVFEDLTSNSEVEGNAFIGGDLLGDSSNYCIKCDSFQPFDGVGLKVVGDIEGNPKNINNGADLEYGGTLNSIINMNGGGTKSQNAGLATEFAQLKNFLIDTSNQLSNLGANSTVDIPGQQPGAVRFNSSGDEIAIFDIHASQLFSSNTQQIELDLNGSESAIINVRGNTVNWTQGNMVGDLTNDLIKQKVLWNFHEAETLEFNNAFYGSLLATNAELTNKTELDGNIVVKSFEQNGEVHLPVFTGELPELEKKRVPEPSFSLLSVLGLGFLSRFKGINSSSDSKTKS